MESWAVSHFCAAGIIPFVLRVANMHLSNGSHFNYLEVEVYLFTTRFTFSEENLLFLR